ncbi:hypothetical protein A8950_1438 [Dongia mobilis]|uniref:DUF2062 domain-containing protein n=2 Tax=Dongia mobilis TaxID=578943 RepID=A0A4R6WU35_9PROT|nr:hypothetical protein A8950_1438 [Dongia mobilis]
MASQIERMTDDSNREAPTAGRRNGRPAGFFRRLNRYIRYRLVTPMLRAKHPAAYSARSVLVGVVCGLMPVIGQSTVVLLVWLVARRFNWGFNVVMAALWTFISNPLTTAPMFYTFYVTGQVMLGNWNDLSGFDRFSAFTHHLIADELGFREQVSLVFRMLFLDWGLAMWTGFIPWAILCGWLGYRWSLRLIIAYRAMREKRMARRRALAAQGVTGT